MSNTPPNKGPPQEERKSIIEATREAENRALDFDPAVRAKYVRSMIQNIALWVSQGDSEQVIMERIPDFAEQYPHLFKAVINREDLSPIQNMLIMLDKMAEGAVSQHQASVVIGKRLADRYITPQLRGNGSNK